MVTIEAPIQELTQATNIIKQIEQDIGEIIFEGAKVAAEAVKERVQRYGQATNGSELMTPSSNPIGRYGQRHGKAREEAGLQVQKVDLYYEGQMWSQWQVEQDNNESAAGFPDDTARIKADNVQDNIYQTPIFVPSEKEIQEAADKMGELIMSELKF